MSPQHPLAVLLADAAAGRFPAPDGGWHRVPIWKPGLEAVVAFTGHAVLAVGSDLPDACLAELGVDGVGGAHDPRVISSLAGAGGWIDSLDLLLVAPGTGRVNEPPILVSRPDLRDHPRVAFAAGVRERLQVMGYDDPDRSAVVILSRGVAGLTEVSFELEAGRRGAGEGAGLVSAALRTVPAGELVVAAAAPGNAASVRVLQSAGFRPVGSIQLFRRRPSLLS